MGFVLKTGKNKQKTIKQKISFRGLSLITDKSCQMTLHPAKKNSGIKFYFKEKYLPALAENIASTNEHTTILSNENYKIIMVEHLMAAIWGMGVDNLIIELNSNFVPARDASSQAYVELLEKAKIIEQNKKRKIIEIKEEIVFKQPQFKNRFAKFKPGNTELIIKSTAPWPDPIGKHTINYKSNPSKFEEEISWARTFLRSPLDLNNLSKWENIRKRYKALPKDPKNSPIITFDNNGFLTPLKEKNEPARHKVLDLIGDLALVGYRIYGKCIINEPGHSFTHKIAKEIRKKTN
jgi:UDP-3-O-[3-hydroxymyristoyl] N-acetylglucosamine deacetylase/3-hydroxyacyl-[acyl-carrier-protein] dehydratase